MHFFPSVFWNRITGWKQVFFNLDHSTRLLNLSKESSSSKRHYNDIKWKDFSEGLLSQIPRLYFAVLLSLLLLYLFFSSLTEQQMHTEGKQRTWLFAKYCKVYGKNIVNFRRANLLSLNFKPHKLYRLCLLQTDTTASERSLILQLSSNCLKETTKMLSVWQWLDQAHQNWSNWNINFQTSSFTTE